MTAADVSLLLLLCRYHAADIWQSSPTQQGSSGNNFSTAFDLTFLYLKISKIRCSWKVSHPKQSCLADCHFFCLSSAENCGLMRINTSGLLPRYLWPDNNISTAFGPIYEALTGCFNLVPLVIGTLPIKAGVVFDIKITTTGLFIIHFIFISCSR